LSAIDNKHKKFNLDFRENILIETITEFDNTYSCFEPKGNVKVIQNYFQLNNFELVPTDKRPKKTPFLMTNSIVFSSRERRSAFSTGFVSYKYNGELGFGNEFIFLTKKDFSPLRASHSLRLKFYFEP
jgi:hypothetical protein